ncbi:MAG: O-acetyl-ADP-ribose deacetylase [Negativicutes bacterium]|nr:O-acetyl-ADP-ribose deacetylase [Negativicutes bacterium]
MELRLHNTLIRAEVGDLTDQDTDGIVNAANSRLAGGGGVDGAVHARGGSAIMKELDAIRQKTGGCPPGQAVVTGGGRLKARYVIHTVGPIYRGRPDDAEVLASCYRVSLSLASGRGLKSLAFPSISTGAYGYPIEPAASVAVETVLAELVGYDFCEIRFILFSARDYQIYRAALAVARDGLTVIRPE